MPRTGPRRPLVALRLGDEVIATVDQLAEQEGVNRSEMIRRLLDEAIAERDFSDPSRECRLCGRDYREQAWTRLFSEQPVAMEPPEPPQDGHVYECCGKVGRISRHETWCPIMKETTT